MNRQELFRMVLERFDVRRLGRNLEDELVDIWRRTEELISGD